MKEKDRHREIERDNNYGLRRRKKERKNERKKERKKERNPKRKG